MVLSTQKKITSLLALGLAAMLLFSGTFAWQNLNQEALNYVKGGSNPGGRLHDDFNNVTDELGAAVKTYNKDVYVENFTSAANDGVNIYARIRLDEYLEWGAGAGTTDANKNTTSLISGATLDNRSSWTTYIPGQKSVFRDYWTLDWTDGGSTVYMPTFNRNKDSLLADINGTFEGGYVKYALNGVDGTETKTGYVIQDNDENDVDELTDLSRLNDLVNKGTASNYYADYASNISVSADTVTHTATTTLNAAASMSMAEWLAAVNSGSTPNVCWVYDSDGWFYWSAPIRPDTATGLLLDGIQRTQKTIGDGGEAWYYGLNVVAQFITADSLGSADDNEGMGSGFYAKEKGEPPTKNALALLKAIGVDVDGTGSVISADVSTQAIPEENGGNDEAGSEAALREALANGGTVTLTGDVELTSAISVEKSTILYLNDFSISAAPDFDGYALFVLNDQNTWLDIDGNGTVQSAPDGCAVQVKEGLLYIWDGTFAGGDAVINVEGGDAVIVDGTFYLQNSEVGQVLRWSANAEIIVYGGNFHDFDPVNADGKNLLSDGYTLKTTLSGSSTVYTVVAMDMEDVSDPSQDASEELEGSEEPEESEESEEQMGEQPDVSPDDSTEVDNGESGTDESIPTDGNDAVGDAASSY